MFDKIKIQKTNKNYGVYEHIDDDKDYYFSSSIKIDLSANHSNPLWQ